MSTSDKCTAISKAGNPCNHRITDKLTSRCAHHSEQPDVVAARQERARSGGRVSRRGPEIKPEWPTDRPPETSEEIRDWLAYASFAVANDIITPETGTRMATLLRATLTAQTAAETARDIIDLRAQIAQLKKGV